MKQSDFILTDLACDSCIARLTKAIKKLKGIKSYKITLESMTVEYNENKVSEQDIIKTVQSLGYNARLSDE
ncbi:MAG TPA: heavy-metal-associated domain-containing protein [Clostridiales bacterium]|jgi:Cu+-exporting ATPase|nr:heavy-metal-associated domain-containing protein [Clostridiales bacterium]